MGRERGEHHTADDIDENGNIKKGKFQDEDDKEEEGEEEGNMNGKMEEENNKLWWSKKGSSILKLSRHINHFDSI